MKIKINAKEYETSQKDLNGLKKELNVKNSDLLFFQGFSADENMVLSEGVSIVIVPKNEKVPQELLKEMIAARNSPEVNEALEKAHVGVAGLGGLGSTVAIALARVGVARLTLIDFDTVDASNLNRQQYFVEDIGRLKTEALKDIIARINPFVEVFAVNERVTAQNASELFAECSLVAECFDNPQSKAVLINNIGDKTVVAASGMAGWGRNEAIRQRKVARNLWVCGDLTSSAGVGNGLMAPRVGVCAAYQANLVLELLITENGKRNL